MTKIKLIRQSMRQTGERYLLSKGIVKKDLFFRQYLDVWFAGIQYGIEVAREIYKDE